MGINFPNTPAVGELHPTPPQAGVPQYRWDGVAWVAQSQDQLAFVKRTGDTMSGALTLPADPAAALQAATKQYVDAKSSLYISDNPPVTPPDGSMWWDSDNGLLYIRYNDGAGPSQWVQAVATPAIDASVFVNKAGDTMGGALALPGDPATALQAAPKQYVDAVRAYAAPYDAIAYSGMQINGSMEVSQEFGAATPVVTNTGKYTLDSWLAASIGVQTIGVTQQQAGFAGLLNTLTVTVNPGNSSPTSSDRAAISTRIEGYRIARLAWGAGANAKPITIAFWVFANRPGTYSGCVANGVAANRSYPFTFTINASNTYEYKTITIPGDTTGTWATGNTSGMEIFFALMLGSTHQAPAGAWTAGTFYGATGTINGVAATSDRFILTGVTVLPGTQAPTAAQSPLIMRPYDQELVTCRRYYYKASFYVPTTYATSFYPVEMRVSPTITGGGAGFVNAGGTPSTSCTIAQTTAAFLTLAFDARL